MPSIARPTLLSIAMILAAASTGAAADPQYKLTILATFNGGNGAQAQGGMVADAVGNLYGTTYSGGSYDQGTLFKIAAGEVDPIHWTSKRVVLGGVVKRPAAPFQRAAPAAELRCGLGSD